MTITDSRPSADPEWMEPFLAALRAYPTVRAAVRASGVPQTTAYERRKRDIRFFQAWEEAVRAPRDGTGGERGHGGGRLDRFLELLAETSNVRAAAAEAGLPTATIYALRRSDPGFAARWYAALAEGYDNLEMELLGRLREGEHAGEQAGTPAEPKRKFDTATALRCLTAHRESVAREKGRRRLAEEVATIASINAKIDALRLRQKINRAAIAKAQRVKAKQLTGPASHG